MPLTQFVSGLKILVSWVGVQSGLITSASLLELVGAAGDDDGRLRFAVMAFVARNVIFMNSPNRCDMGFLPLCLIDLVKCTIVEVRWKLLPAD